ncbi:MAG: fumarylacetoacetate hydrolase family protein [Pseudomonadota bacterium]|nr:fumarylacetoacetate hydrolase family protein [Pseudomonadota bacterium]
MKLVTVIGHEGIPQVGALIGGGNVALFQTTSILLDDGPKPYFADMLSFLRAGPEARYRALMLQELAGSRRAPDAIVPLNEARLLSPVPVPESIRDCMLFEDHIINATRTAGLGRLGPLDEMIEKRFGRERTLARWLNRSWYKHPSFYKSNRFNVVGHEATVRMPAGTRKFDYELEWGVFIGKEGRDIPASRAAEHIAGYVIFNDFSARDIQLEEMGARLGPAKGKDFDTGNAIGPWLVTTDEISEPYKLTMTARVNDMEWSRGTTADMKWSFEEVISYISRSETLYPGEFIGSGTCSGSQGKGCGLELGRFLEEGDVVELEVENVGKLRNTVERAPRKPQVRPARASEAEA